MDSDSPIASVLNTLEFIGTAAACAVSVVHFGTRFGYSSFIGISLAIVFSAVGVAIPSVHLAVSHWRELVEMAEKSPDGKVTAEDIERLTTVNGKLQGLAWQAIYCFAICLM